MSAAGQEWLVWSLIGGWFGFRLLVFLHSLIPSDRRMPR